MPAMELSSECVRVQNGVALNLYSINNVSTGKQLNVHNAAKESATEIITYAPTEAENSQFLLKAV